MKINLPSQDEIDLIKLKSKYLSQLNKVLSYEEEQAELIKSLGTRMNKTAAEKRKLIEIINTIIELEEIAIRNPASSIDRDEIETLKKSSRNLTNSLNNQEDLAGAFLDLASIFKEFLKRKSEYVKEYKNLISTEEKLQDIAYQYMKLKNKFVNEAKLQKYEDKIRDLTGKIKRIQRQVDSRIKTLMEEAKTLDTAWREIKNLIRNYGW